MSPPQHVRLQLHTGPRAAQGSNRAGFPRSACRYFSVKEAYEEGLVDKLVPGFMLNRFRKMQKDAGMGGEDAFSADKPKFKFTRTT